jgi:small conductance mechanosensitive channel
LTAFPLIPASIASQTGSVLDRTQAIWSSLSEFGRTTVGPIISVLVILALALVILRVLRTLIRRMIRRLVERNEKPNRELTLKINTLSSVVESGGRALVIVIASMMILSNIGINIAPLLASAGVAGIAIGLGAQSLIKDVIGGFLILFEDQYGVGDVISVNNYSGVVEHLSLRRTGLRGTDGSFTIIANGDVRAVQNMTKDWSRAVIDIDISHDDDIDQAVDTLTEMLKDIQHDPELGSAILEPADILSVQAMGPYQVTLRILVKTRPMEQWRVQRVLLRRFKKVLYTSGATIPYPRSETVVRTLDAQTARTPLFAGVQDNSTSSDE